MKARKTISHEQAIELLPWLVNGSMDEDEQEKVREHAQSCVVCRRELHELELINNFIADAARSEPIPPPDMRNINARIDELIERKGRMREWMSHLAGAGRNPWRLAFAAQTFLVIVLAFALFWPQPEEAEFVTLTQPQSLPEGHFIRAVFNPEMSVTDLASLLDEMRLTVSDGPSPRGVYTLGLSPNLSPDARADLLATLQQNPDVQFAQWVVHHGD